MSTEEVEALLNNIDILNKSNAIKYKTYKDKIILLNGGTYNEITSCL